MTIALAAHRRLSAKLLLWRRNGQHQLTIIGKMTGRFVQNGEVELIEPRRIEHQDRFLGGDPTRDLETINEAHPLLPRCDVVLWGSVHPPAETPTDASGLRTFTSRLLLVHDDKPILDRTVVARLYPSEAHAPLTYTKALGGTGAPDNPIGTPSPVFLDPFDTKRPTGFGAIPKFWPARKRLIGEHSLPSLGKGAIDLPGQFPFEILQTAPRDQQIDHLRGGEWLVLQNLNPRAAEVCTCLPIGQVEARVWFGGAKLDVPLATDMLLIHADDDRVEIVARAVVPLGEAVPNDIRVAVTLVDRRFAPDWVSLQLVEDPFAASPPPSLPGQETITLVGPAAGAAAIPSAPPSSKGKKGLGETVATDDQPPSLRAPFPMAPPVAPASRPSHPSIASATPWGAPLPNVETVKDEPLTRTKPLSLQNILANLPVAPSTLQKAVPPSAAPSQPGAAPPPARSPLAQEPTMPPDFPRQAPQPSPTAPRAHSAPTPYRAPHASSPYVASASGRPPGPARPQPAPSHAKLHDDPLVARLRASGASEADINALIARLAPAPPPPSDE